MDTTSSILALPAHGTQAITTWEFTPVADVVEFAHRCERIGATRPSPFQHAGWLKTWYRHLSTVPGVQPRLLAVRAGGDSGESMLLPLVRRRIGRLQVAEWADLGITDYNAPIMRDGLQLSPASAAALGRGLRHALRDCDLLWLRKMPLTLGSVQHPLVQALATQPSEMFGNRFHVHERYADWMQHLGKHARKEFERQWRVFTRHPGAVFVRAETVPEGLKLLRDLAAQQSHRQAHTAGYFLDQPPYVAFYEDLLREQLPHGRVVVTALMAGDEMVAGLYSVFDGERFTMLRISMGGEAWKACAPGKLLLERSIAHMHAQGCREFDFAIGDYPHKRVFCTTPYPLREACVALSWRGTPAQAAWRLKCAIKANPAVLARARQLRARLRR